MIWTKHMLIKAKSVNKTPITMICGTYNQIMRFINQRTSLGAPHCMYNELSVYVQMLVRSRYLKRGRLDSLFWDFYTFLWVLKGLFVYLSIGTCNVCIYIYICICISKVDFIYVFCVFFVFFQNLQTRVQKRLNITLKGSNIL